MNTRLVGLAGLAVALTLMAGGTGATIRSASAAAPASVYSVGAGLDAGSLYRLAAPAAQVVEDPACATQAPDSAEEAAKDAADTDNVQDENGADDATEVNGEPEAANDTDTIQDENGADDATEVNGEQESANDTDKLECGDQSGSDASGQASTAGTVRASLLNAQVDTAVEAPKGVEGTESATGGDEAADGILCEQQGENEGENAGC